MQRIILFDGVCNFCSSSVQFIIKRDPVHKFQFASLQSDVGQQLLTKYQVSQDMDSMVLIEKDRVYTKSTAALRIAKELKGAYQLLSIFLIIPKPIRDIFYNILANNRYRWFGKKNQCMLPKPEDRQRFLDT
ncbi:Predicted thiol-disulfide oxidoreductase YuxK, DCC family [Gracilibacillus orientalis]|uniref:Predicted thiol-disulfide oxidoreductase YuxK, DCC family n=1 Tax=Gracilibacillus orientalis TaxID=334253 RepID=A0A1I4H4W8_9BACI|nr:thiol-disulfide oxidoreductase DCC family protein [Gracilibacillus orientalis]SFL36441.1 Predicted thiol-disulfide oxidoreductase YuxK, DCC family [Gracilibacillus orientalis]